MRVTDLSTELIELQQQFVARPLEAASSSSFASRLRTVLQGLSRAQPVGNADVQLFDECKAQVRQLDIIFRSLDGLAGPCARIVRDGRAAAEQHLLRFGQSEGDEHPAPSPPAARSESDRVSHLPKESSPENSSLTLPYRTYFLDHFAWPYPTSSERDELLALLPTHGRAQLSTWFINSRRRSGWSALCKKYGGGTKEGVEACLERLANGQATTEEIELVDKVRKHLEEDSTSIRPEVKAMVEELEVEARGHGRKRGIDEVDHLWTDETSSKRTFSDSASTSASTSTSPSSPSSAPMPPTPFPPSVDPSVLFAPQVPPSNETTPGPFESSIYATPHQAAPVSQHQETLRSISNPLPVTAPASSTRPLRAVSSSFLIGQEASLAGSLSLPMRSLALDSFWCSSPSMPSNDLDASSRVSSDGAIVPDLGLVRVKTNVGGVSELTSSCGDSSSTQWFETLYDDRWKSMYPWLSDGLEVRWDGSDRDASGSGTEGWGVEGVDWLM